MSFHLVQEALWQQVQSKLSRKRLRNGVRYNEQNMSEI